MPPNASKQICAQASRSSGRASLRVTWPGWAVEVLGVMGSPRPRNASTPTLAECAPTEEDLDAQADLLDDSLAGRLHRRPRRRDRLVGARRGAASVPQRRGAGA